jgi:hypothetical protein
MTLAANEIFYMALGLATVAVLFFVNAPLFRRRGPAGGVSALEFVCYLTALAALGVGWYFNLEYMREYGAQGGWAHWTRLLFVNPASASGGQDLIFANVVLFPLWTITDGRRSGMRLAWWYFVMSLVTSFAFAMALFLAFRERQLRWNRGR